MRPFRFPPAKRRGSDGRENAMEKIVLQSPAKINLCLSVLGKRPDGYHEVSMLMQMVGLCDEVSVARRERGITVSCDADGVPAGEGNIAWRAAAAVLAATGSREGLAIEIRKRIPVAAGLAGGSGNAAAVLAGANRLLDCRFDRARLAEIGAGLGMDVPFFFYGPTAAARGRGEVLDPLPPVPAFWVLLVNPGFATATAEVYRQVNLRLTKNVDCTTIAGLSVRNIARNLHNDLETVTAAAHPVIAEIEGALIDAGALGARMSGSGPTVFGIFETGEACSRAEQALTGRGWRLFPVQALTRSPLEVYHMSRASGSER